MEQFIQDSLVLNKEYNYDSHESIMPLTNVLSQLPENATLQLSKNKTSVIDLYNPELHDNEKKDILNILCRSYFIPVEVIIWAESIANKLITITYNNISINILTNKPIAKEIIFRMISIIEWIRTITNNKEREMVIYIIASPYEKHLSDVIGYKEINSGMSYNDVPGYIVIFRMEELYKMLIHEVIHNLSADMDEHEFTSIKNVIKVHKSSHKVLYNEAYVEAISNYLYSYFYSKVHSCDFETVLYDEYIFSHIQVNKLFKHYGITTIDYFKTKNNCVQYTNVISYFVIKYHLLKCIKSLVNVFMDKEKTKSILLFIIPLIYNFEMYDDKIIISDNSMKMIKNDFL